MKLGGYTPSLRSATGTHDLCGLFGGRLCASVPGSFDNADLIVDVLDQLGTSACVANAGAQVIRGELVRAGVVNPPLPSRLFLYWAPRSAGGYANIDGGTSPSECLAAVQQVGFCSESDWPFDPFCINDQPPWSAFRKAADQRWLAGYARIDSSGSRLVDELKQAIASRALIWTGSRIDQAYVDIIPGEIWRGPVGKVVGGHSYVITSYDDGLRAFRYLSSWGTSYGSGGYGWLAYDAADALEDNWAVNAAPNYSGT